MRLNEESCYIIIALLKREYTMEGMVQRYMSSVSHHVQHAGNGAVSIGIIAVKTMNYKVMNYTPYIQLQKRK